MTRRASWAMLVIAALGLMAVVGISCNESSSEPTASPRPTASPAATASPVGTASAPASSSPVPDVSGTVWLCRPGLADNPCESSLETTVVNVDGTTAIQSAVPAENPPIDCFYVYPTVSG